MRLTALLLIVGMLHTYANGWGQNVTISGKNLPLKQVLVTVKNQTGYYVLSSLSALESSRPVTVEARNLPLDKFLAEVFKLLPNLEYEIHEKNIFISEKMALYSSLPSGKENWKELKDFTNNYMAVTGKVADSTGTPLRGAIVSLSNKAVSTVTDENGRFEINADQGDVISVSYIGYEPAKFIVTASMPFQYVVLRQMNTALTEISIVSTGYQTISRERATGSFGVITAKELSRLPSPNILQRLEGQIAGLQMNITSSDRSFAYNNTQLAVSSNTRTIGKTDYSINIRGTGTLVGESMPLIVIDGAISEIDLSALNPNDIENITVLKDAAAASIWGVRAANGVIVITTKQGVASQAPSVSFSATFMQAEKPNLGYLRIMNAAQVLDYEKEAVDKGFIINTTPNTYNNAALLNSEGASLALQLKAGTITPAQYSARVNELSAIDNRSQISKYLLRSNSNQQYNLSINGGAGTSRYFYSASYSRELPNTAEASGSRLTLLLNNSWKIWKVVTLTTNLKGSFFKYANNGISLGSIYQPSRTTLLPYQLLADENGNGVEFNKLAPAYTSTLSQVYKKFTYNYLEELANADNVQKADDYTANINLTVPVYKGLSASVIYNSERAYSNNRTFSNQNVYSLRRIINYYTFPGAARNSLGITNGGSLGLVNTVQNNYSLRGQLSYTNSFKGIHQVDAIAGTEIRETNVGQSTATLWGYNMVTGLTNANINYTSTPSYQYIDAATATSYTSFTGGGYPTQTDKKRRFLSYYSNVAYSLLEKYTLSGSVRYDDYNNFGLDRKYRATPLWSAGFKWNAAKESFLKPIKWIDYLSLRATYGINGNLSLSTYPYTAISLSGSNDPVSGESYALIAALANPQLKWEKTYVTNLGLDFSFLKSALSGTVDIYRKRGRDLLYSLPINTTYTGNIGTSSGISYLTRNTTAINGSGIDISLKARVWENANMDFTIGGTFSYNKNEVADTRFSSNSYASFFGYYPLGVGAISGYPTDKLLVYRFAGLDDKGLTQIYDESGGKITSAQTNVTSFGVLKYAGRMSAPYYGGLNTGFRYKQLSIYALATYQLGNVFLKPTITNYITSNFAANYDLSAAIADRWKNPGDELKTNVPALSNSYYSLARYQSSDINVLKGDYLRLRQVTITYQVAPAVLNRYKIKGAQISATVNNLGLLWRANKEGYDPDYAASSLSGVSSLPPVRSYTLSLNLNF